METFVYKISITGGLSIAFDSVGFSRRMKPERMENTSHGLLYALFKICFQ